MTLSSPGHLAALSMMLSVSLVAGCRPADDELRERVAAIAGMEAEEAARTVNGLADEVEQLATVEALFLQHGTDLDAALFCSELDRYPVRQRCTSLRERPHLLAAGSEPAITEAAPKTRGCDSECLQRDTPLACAREVATAAVDADDEQPANVCDCLDAGRTRDECRFAVAEILVERRGVDGYEGALGLCIDSGEFGHSCAEHLLIRLAANPPPLSAEGAEAWAERIPVATRIGTEALGAERRLLEDPVDTYWSLSLMEAMRRSTAVAPEVADALPGGAQRHLRAAAAWRLEQLDPDPARSLDDQVGRLTKLLAGEALLPPPADVDTADYGPLGQPTPRQPVPPGAGFYPRSTVYLGRDRRAYSSDPWADMAICILEAQTRIHPGVTGPLEEALAADDPTLRWAAEQLASRK